MSVRGSASGLGDSPFSRIFFSANASIGVRAHFASAPSSFGGSTLAKGCSDHHALVFFVFSVSFMPAGQPAPLLIQSLIAATSSLVSLSPLLGIFGSSPLIISTNRLAAASPAMMASPLSPPFIASFSSERFSLPLRVLSL